MNATSLPACLCVAAALLSTARGAWQYHLPSTGLLPSAAAAEFVATAGERHNGGGSLGLQNYTFTVPFADPRRSNWNDWYINACLDAEVTHLSTSGALVPDGATMYSFTLPMSVIHPMSGGQRLILTLAPHVATDFNGPAHAFGMGGFVDYRLFSTDSFSASVGTVCMPNETYYWFVPFATFEWNPTPDWELSLKGFRFQAMRQLGHGLAAGAFARGIGGAWATHGEAGTRLLRVRSLALGGRAEWDFSQPGQTKRILFADVGATVFTMAQKLRYDDLRNSESMHHYHPALYVSAGADFRF